MRLRTLFPGTLSLLVLASSVWAAPEVDLKAKVKAFVEASNQHDVEAMVAAVDPRFRWMQIEGEKLSVEVVGPEQLRSWLDGYFRSTPDARSKVTQILVDGNYVTAIEQVEYRDGQGQPRQQTATSVYQFDPEGRILNVWYFPPQEDAAPAATAAP